MSVELKIREAVVSGDAEKVQELTEKAINSGADATYILNEGLIAGMTEIGIKFKNKEVFVPEMMIAARAMQSGLKVVKPILVESGVKEKGTVLIGTVEGDLHDIGKNIVIMMLEGGGYKVIDLGIDVPAEKFLKAVAEYTPDILGLSALLTTTMHQMEKTVNLLKQANNNIKVMVGGAPVTDEFAKEIGADAFAIDAIVAVEKADTLLGLIKQS